MKNLQNINLRGIITHLANEVNDEITSNGITNEMDALFDYGEFSGSDPNFSHIVEKWKLTRPMLCTYIDKAEEWATEFERRKPAEHKKWMGYGPNYSNPWEDKAHTLHCIFMNGTL